jgi:preprotein translocase subunit SecF
MANPEYHTGSVERSEVERAAAERAKELREQTEHKHEHPETAAEHDARQEAEKEAKSVEDYRPSEHEGKKDARVFTGEHSRDKSYKETMQSVERELSAPERVFSKIIHTKTVETVSDTVGSTVARPNAILAGSICAFVLVLVVYLVARDRGYGLSGFETIGAFIIGWIIGVLIDFLRVMISGKR